MTSFLDGPSPRWYTIPAHRPFLLDLAQGLWSDLAKAGPAALADAIILVPTRRAGRALADAFLTASGSQAVLLPQVRALGDLDEGEPPFEIGDLALDLAPAINPWRRRFELAALVAAHEALLNRKLDAGGALELADTLAGFLDACQLEEVGDDTSLDTLVEGELARHWQISARFLKLAIQAWPKRLAELGLMDPAARRVAMLRRLEDRWHHQPPSDIIIAAGSTGTTPATAALLHAIANAPNGCVVLPGLDKALAEAAWTAADDQHPQGALKRLLDRSGLTRADVRDWNPEAEISRQGRWRRRLINEALRPPEATADWLQQIADLRAEGVPGETDPVRQGLEGLTAITTRNEEEASAVVALLLREALEAPDRTVALITHDADLGRRVSARLSRWGIEVESSLGRPLAGAPAAVLAGLIARVTIDPVDPVTLLAILKHPLTRLGLPADTLDAARRTLELKALRGPRYRDWEALETRLTGDADALETLAGLARALSAASLAFEPGDASVAEAARGLATALEILAGDAGGETGGLWQGQAGEGLGRLVSALIEDSDGLPPITASGFSDLLANLLARENLHSGRASHPRVQILGVLEARLVRADLLVLAGLQEGVWPPAAPIDPLLSRPMRERLGLPMPERRIGLSAHDFAQAASAPEVVLVDCERHSGAPAMASRWLWRLRTLARGACVEIPGRPDLLAWARALDAPLASPPESLRTAGRPGPTPPVASRPRKLPVTGIERWVRDPYGVYARYILELYPLERPDEPVDARARGTAIHNAFERFALAHPVDLPEDAEDEFAWLIIEALTEAGMPAARITRETARARTAARWVVGFEQKRRPGADLHVEKKGEMILQTAGGPFVITAKADRIEDRGDRADILDFKTGAAPTKPQVLSGLAPQLTLTGAILASGGFAQIGPRPVGELLYVRVSGGREAGREEVRAGVEDSEALVADALAGLKRRIDLFDNPATPYRSWAAAQFVGRHGGDYDHLARLWEWYVIGDAPEGDEG